MLRADGGMPHGTPEQQEFQRLQTRRSYFFFATLLDVGRRFEEAIRSPEGLSLHLDLVCTDAIMAQYGAKNRDDEINIRLRGESTPQQDIERDRVRARYRAVKTEIVDAPDDTALKSIQARIEDGTWANDPV